RHSALQTVARGKALAGPVLDAPTARILAQGTERAALARVAKAHPAFVGGGPDTAAASRGVAVAQYSLLEGTGGVLAEGTRFRAKGERLFSAGLGQPERRRRQRHAAAGMGRGNPAR